jgi:predicted glycosyltransferase
VVLADKHPLGVTGELREALDRHRKMGGRTALGLRDILDERATVLREWALYDLHERITEYYDRVLIYGNEEVFDPIREYDFPDALAAKAHFCGYVVTSRTLCSGIANDLVKIVKHETRPLVVATPGGGEDGYALLKTFIQAARGQAWDGIAITGPLARESDLADLARMAEEAGVALHSFVAELPEWFAACDTLVCMGGYNTLTEAIVSATPTVCVPRTQPRTEQQIRARAFARLGLVCLIEPSELNVERLRREIESSLALGRNDIRGRAQSSVEFDGARRAAMQLLELAEAELVSQPGEEIAIES